VCCEHACISLRDSVYQYISPCPFPVGQVRHDNEVLFHRVATLTREAAELRTQMIREWARCGAAEQRGTVEIADRRALLSAVETQLAQSRSRLTTVTAENARLEALGAQLRTGLLRLRDVLQVGRIRGEWVSLRSSVVFKTTLARCLPCCALPLLPTRVPLFSICRASLRA
jgi:cell division protein FtsB